MITFASMQTSRPTLQRAADIDSFRIGKRHTGKHQLGGQTTTEDGFSFGQLRLVVDAQHLIR
jgi:hypothetical protein